MTGELVKISAPNKAEYSSVIRLAAASASSLAGLNIEDIEDVRLAVGEMCAIIIEQPEMESIDMEIKIGLRSVEIRAKIGLCPEEMEISYQIIHSVMDKFDCRDGTLIMEKNASNTI